MQPHSVAVVARVLCMGRVAHPKQVFLVVVARGQTPSGVQARGVEVVVPVAVAVPITAVVAEQLLPPLAPSAAAGFMA